jgi:hypothetical protein
MIGAGTEACFELQLIVTRKAAIILS